MPAKGGAGNANAHVFTSVELKGTSNQLTFQSLGNQTIISDGNPGANVTLTLPTTTGTIALLSDVQASDTLAEILANGNTTGGTNIAVTAGDAITFGAVTDEIAGIQNQNLVDKSASEVITGSWDFGGAGSLEIPNGAAPTVNADGEIAIDTTVTDFSHGLIKYFSTEEVGVVAMPIAQFTTPTDGFVVAYNATNDEFELVSNAATPSLDDAYNNGNTIDVDGDAVTMTVSDTDNNAALILNQNDTTNNPNALEINNTGTGAGISLTGDAAIVAAGTIVNTPKADQSLVAANAIDVSDARQVQVSGSGGAVTLTSTPTIADGTNGQEIILIGVDDTNTLTVQSEGNLAGSNLYLSGDVNFELGLGDTLHLAFNTTRGGWVEVSRSDN